MTKQRLNKLLSCLLVLAICSATVFGCLISANAQDGPTYEVSDVALGVDATSATVPVSFTIPSGMAAGYFTVEVSPFDNFADVEVAVTGGTRISGAYTADDFDAVVVNGDIADGSIDVGFSLARPTNDNLYSSVTLGFTFTFASAVAAGTEYSVSVSGFDFSGLYDVNYTEFTGTNGKITSGCNHVFEVSGDPAYTDEANGYAVYATAECKLCGEAKDGYQVVPVLQEEEVVDTSTSTYTDANNGTTFTEGDGTEGNPFIVETADQFAAVARGYVVTEGKYFKVKDGVKAFYMNGGETVANLTSAAAVKEYFTTNGGLVWWTPNTNSVSEYFKGNFDGNGVTVYGLYTGSTELGNPQGSAALFPKTGAGAVIKNITLKNSYIEGNVTGGIVATGYDTNDAGYKLVLENIAVINNVIKCNNTVAASFGGIVYAYTQNYAAEVTNCVVYGNDASYTNFTTTEMPVFSFSNASGLNKFYYIVSIGHSLQGNSWHTKAVDNGMYRWVYSDRIDENTNYSATQATKFNLTVLEPEQMLGPDAKANMPLLDWYSEENDDGIWVAGAEGECPLIVLPAKVAKPVYWTINTYDDDFIVHADQPGDGSESNPYVIYDAEDLASVVAARVVNVLGAARDNTTPIDTTGVYFKVSDDVSAFYMANDDATYGSPDQWDTIEKVKAALSNKAGVYKWWQSDLFKGHFDGNGATVYGLFADKENAGLFQQIGKDATIKNIAVKNSYFNASTGCAGAIAGQIQWRSGIGDGTLTIDGCVSQNNYFAGAADSMGALVGHSREDKIIVNNCLVADNGFAEGKEAYIVGNGWNAANVISNTIVVNGLAYGSNNALKKNEIFSNVYTNTDQSGSGYTYEANQITVLDLAQMQGVAAKKNMPNLAWGSVWFTSSGYPSFVEGPAVTVATSTDAGWKLLAANIEYQNSGNFTLNFHYAPPYEAGEVALYVPNAAGKTGFSKLIEARASSQLADAMMFSVPNLSAKDIDILWLPTIVTLSQDGSNIVYSATEQISVEDYANAVIDGKATYANSATDEQKADDIKVAAALVNYGYAAKDALASNTTPEITYSTYTDPNNGKIFAQGDGTEGNPYIVETADQFAAVARGYVVTEGKYFKVKDGVKAFYMNGGETVANLTSADAVKEYFTTNGGLIWWEPTSNSTSEYFKGNFDGNGVTIYGLYTGSTAKGSVQSKAALFPKVDGSVTIKNINLKNSYIEGGTYAAGIIAGSGSTAGLITLENCSVEDCYIISNRNSADHRSFGGVLLANTAQTLHAYNCIVVDNIATYAYDETELMPVISSSANSSTVGGNTVKSDVSNLIVIGSSVCGQGWSLFCIGDKQFKNVYTDSDLADLKAKNTGNTDATLETYNVRSVSKADLQGVKAIETTTALANAATATGTDPLDWDNVWCYGAEGKYPMIVPVSNDEVEEVISIRTGEDRVLYLLDETQPNSESNPYIVETANQMYMLVRMLSTDSEGNNIATVAGNYFKVADGIKAFYINGGENLAAMNSAADVKNYFETTADSISRVWTGSKFAGHFDGNGVEIYGLRSDDSYGGLFPMVTGNVSIKNVVVKNSYFKAVQPGGIIGTTNNDSATVIIENCAVINNYIESTDTSRGAASLVCSSFGCTITAKDILVYGNDFVSKSTASYGSVSYGWSANSTFTNMVTIGYAPYRVNGNSTNGNASHHYCKGEAFSNVYTDLPAASSYESASVVTEISYTSDQIKTIAVDDIKGEKAVENMSLAWGTDWYAGNRGEYPSLTPVVASYMPASVQALYDAMTLSNYDDYGESTENFGMYATSLNLKANPYMAFTFAFNGEYKQSADVSVTFSDGTNTIATVTAAEMVNNDGAGRYHLYRLKNAPVIALCNGITITANGTDFGTFSAEGFALEAYRANRINPCDYYSTRYEAAKALLFYSQMLAERYGA